jgi:hypothetical protein
MKGKAKKTVKIFTRKVNPNATPTTTAKKLMDLVKPRQPCSKGNFPKKGKSKGETRLEQKTKKIQGP